MEAIVTIIIVNYLRRILRTSGNLPRWNKLLMATMVVSIALLTVSSAFSAARPICSWLTHALILTVLYIIFTRKEFSTVKSIIYAALPIVVVRIVSDLIELFQSQLISDWKNYFEIAELFAFVWMIGMWIVFNRQRKALEKERLKAEEKEREHKITETLKAQLEVQVAERTAALTEQKKELEKTILELKATQSLLIQSEKMASLGELTAGIAHEIQNPLNFVNNFSEVSNELIDEMKTELAAGNFQAAIEIANDVKQNLDKIIHHGNRADGIVKGMLQHSRSSGSAKELTDINALVDEYLRLAYHGLRAKDKSFNASMKTEFDPNLEKVPVIPQDIGRVVLNLITNSFYAVTEKGKQAGEGYKPTVTVGTKKRNNQVEITVKDNGTGIPQKVVDKIFQPFFTTKPTGQGTGLGLSLSYDIVKAHGGELNVMTREGEGSEFTIRLPIERS